MTNSMPWFRVYSEILDDRKIKRICKRTGHSKAMVIGTWVCLLALASDSPERGNLIISGGMPYTVDEIADELGLDNDTTESLLSEFEAMGMISLGETMAVTNWNKRQFPSDNSTERVRQFRNKNNETLQKRYSNALDTDTDIDTEEKKKENAPAPAAASLKISTSQTIPAILMRAAGLSTIPPDEIKREKQLTDMIEVHGPERTEEALKNSAKEWKATKNKNGKPYPITNMAWVDKAQNILDAGSNGNGKLTWAKWDTMTDEQRQAHVDAGGDLPRE